MIRTMAPDDVAQAVAWAAREGWNPGLADAPAFLAQDPGAFLMAEQDGAMRSCISVTKYGDGFGFLGFYIAAPEVRGQGLGMAVWQAGMARLEGRVVGLDGVVAQQDNYRKSGFHFAWNNARYMAQAVQAGPPGVMLPRADSVHFDALAAYDAACFGTPRPAFLRAWIDTPSHVALVLPGLRGFGVVRPARHGSKIGPLFADDAAGARRLFAALVAAAPPGPITLDVPEDHAQAVAIAREAGMTKVFETARMYTAAPPPMARDRLFGVTSLELG